MSYTATHIEHVIYDALTRQFQATLAFFSPGLPIPLRVGVALHAAESLNHAQLTRHLVGAGQRSILKRS